MRWCGSRSNFDTLMVHVAQHDELDETGLELLEQVILRGIADDENDHDVSVYRAADSGPDSLGYRLGVMAVALCSKSLDPDQTTSTKSKYKKRKGTTISFDAESMRHVGCVVPHTPNGCLTLTHAAPFHHDIQCGPAREQSCSDLYESIWKLLKSSRFTHRYVDIKEEGVEPFPFEEFARTTVRTVECVQEIALDDRPREGGKTADWQQRAIERLEDLFSLGKESIDCPNFRREHAAEIESMIELLETDPRLRVR